MEIYLNLWGGDGYLTSSAIFAMAAMGMFDDLTDTNTNVPNSIIYNMFDFVPEENYDRRRSEVIFKGYIEYYCGIFRKDSTITTGGKKIYDLICRTNPATLYKKYKQKDMMAFGCTEEDMEKDISRGIYGKPTIGETYYSDTKFEPIYDSASGNIVIINSGGYKGGGTAATFIPQENRYRPTDNNGNITGVERFCVLTGPSTQFKTTVTLDYPNIYPRLNLTEINMFDIKYDPEKDSFWIGGKELIPEQDRMSDHQANVKKLTEVLKKIGEDTSLDPRNYMPRFLERVRSDLSLNKIDASFIHLKPNLKRTGDSFNYDITSEEFHKDNPHHKLHITNLLNAIAIRELAVNHSQYTQRQRGKFLAVGDPTDIVKQFTVSNLFSAADAVCLYRFLVFSVLIINYVYNFFYDSKLSGANHIIDKWALTTNPNIFKFTVKVNFDEKTTDGERNLAFAVAVKNALINTANEYIKLVLDALTEINDTCPDVILFKDNLKNIVTEIAGKITVTERGEKTIEHISGTNSAQDIIASTENMLAEIKSVSAGIELAAALNVVKGNAGVDGFLIQYQQGFPEFGTADDKGVRRWDANAEGQELENKAKIYCNKILKYTFEKADSFIQ